MLVALLSVPARQRSEKNVCELNYLSPFGEYILQILLRFPRQLPGKLPQFIVVLCADLIKIYRRQGSQPFRFSWVSLAETELTEKSWLKMRSSEPMRKLEMQYPRLQIWFKSVDRSIIRVACDHAPGSSAELILS